MSILTQAVIDAFSASADATVEKLRSDVMSRWPDAKAARTSVNVEGERSCALSILHSPAGDAVELQWELRLVDGKLWCDATIYLGQETAMMLQSACWIAGPPSAAEVAAIMHEFVPILFPRILALAELTRRREQEEESAR